ncbi:hypothetical protein [Anaplasma marginale]|uniref:hypothetical protein n=1 Tax=Anaplasma marginale TaxID=770 RepID=UPI00114588BD|nr:hypothetical protein [Anaplasma marginale]
MNEVKKIKIDSIKTDLIQDLSEKESELIVGGTCAYLPGFTCNYPLPDWGQIKFNVAPQPAAD